MSQTIAPETQISPDDASRKTFSTALTFVKANYVPILLTLNFALALFLRTYNLATNPGGFDQDEAVNGVDALSISLTLRDHHGNFLPPMLESFGDWVSPTLTYFTVPFVLLLGLSEFSVRLPVAMLGAGAVLLMYFLVKRLTHRKDLGLLAGFFLAVMPWSVMSSRWAIPPSSVTFFLLLFLCVYCWASDARLSLWKFALAGICAAVLCYAYPAQKVFLPMLLGVLALGDLLLRMPWREWLKKYLAIGLPFALLVSPIYILTLLNPAKYNSRFSVVSIFQPGVDPIPTFLQNYLSYLLPNFYFEKDSGLISDHVPGIEKIFNFLAPFYFMALVLCVISLVAKKPFILNKRAAILLLAWWLLFPVPASLTRDILYQLRIIHGLSLILILAVVGFGDLLRFVKSKKVLSGLYIGIVALTAFYAVNFSVKYFEEYPAISGEFYLYGTRQYSEFLIQNDGKFDAVTVDSLINMPYIFTVFYSGKDPRQYDYADYANVTEGRDINGRWVGISKLGKYTYAAISDSDVKDATELLTTKDKNGKVYFQVFAKGRQWYVVKTIKTPPVQYYFV